MYLFNPKDRQRYFIRLLLLHVKGATLFENLRSVNCVIHPTYYEAAVAKHLVNEDEEWDRCLRGQAMVRRSKNRFFFIYYFDRKFSAEYDTFHRISKFDFD